MADEAAGVRVLREINCGPWELVAVLTPLSSNGRPGVSVGEAAASLGHSVWPAREVTTPQLAERLKAASVDLLLNVHSLHRIHSEVIGAVRIGGFNLHPGPLPHYAGLNAPSWAIANGEKCHSVTLHWLEAGIDTGPVAFSASFGLTDRDTGLSVSARCFEYGLPLVGRLLNLAETDPAAIPRLPQDTARRRYFGRRDIPYGGRVPWALSAGAICALVRASDYDPMPSPWGAPLTRVGTLDVGIAKVRRTNHPCEASPGTVGTVGVAGAEVATADEWLLVTQLSIDDRRVRADAVLRAGLPLT